MSATDIENRFIHIPVESNKSYRTLQPVYEFHKKFDAGILYHKPSDLMLAITCEPIVLTEYEEAIEYAKQLNVDNFGGFQDWRLPSCYEIQEFINMNYNFDDIANYLTPIMPAIAFCDKDILDCLYFSPTSNGTLDFSLVGYYPCHVYPIRNVQPGDAPCAE